MIRPLPYIFVSYYLLTTHSHTHPINIFKQNFELDVSREYVAGKKK